MVTGEREFAGYNGLPRLLQGEMAGLAASEVPPLDRLVRRIFEEL